MNQKKKILLVSSAFHPEVSPRSFRATELAKEYYRQGHEVTVLTKQRDYDYSTFLKTYPINFKTWGRHRYPKLPEKSFRSISRIIARLLMLLFEYPVIEEKKRVRKALKKESGYDLMISFAVPYPIHWGVAKIRSEKHPVAKIWVADCGDPYMFTRLDRFRKPFYFKYQEKKFCRKCDFMAVPFEDMRNQFYPEFKSKIKVIPQGFDFSEIDIQTSPPENDKPVFIFAGSVIPGKRDLSDFLEYLISKSFDFKFIIYTNQKDWFTKFKNALGEKLVLNDYINRLSLIKEMSKADFLVNVDTIHDVKENIEAIPSKLIDYALSGRPILNISSANLDTDLVEEFLKKDYSRQRNIDKSRYDIKEVSKSFLKLLS